MNVKWRETKTKITILPDFALKMSVEIHLFLFGSSSSLICGVKYFILEMIELA